MLHLILLFFFITPNISFSSIAEEEALSLEQEKIQIVEKLGQCFKNKSAECSPNPDTSLREIKDLQNTFLQESILKSIWPKIIQRYLQLRILSKRLGLTEEIPSASLSERTLPQDMYPLIFKELYPFEPTFMGKAFGKDTKKGKIFSREEKVKWEHQIQALTMRYKSEFLPDALDKYLQAELMLIPEIQAGEANPMQVVADKINPFIDELNLKFIRPASLQYIEEELDITLGYQARKAFKQRLLKRFEDFIFEKSATSLGQIMLTPPLLSYIAKVREKIDHLDSIKKIATGFTLGHEHYSHKFLEHVDRPGNIAYSRDHLGYRMSTVANPATSLIDFRNYSSSLRSAGPILEIKDFMPGPQEVVTVPINSLATDHAYTKAIMQNYIKEQVRFLQGLSTKIMQSNVQLKDVVDEIFSIAPDLIIQLSDGNLAKKQALIFILCKAIKEANQQQARKEMLLKGIRTFLPVISLPVTLTAVAIGISGMAGVKAPAIIPIALGISGLILKGLEAAHQQLEYAQVRDLQRKALSQMLVGGKVHDLTGVMKKDLPHPEAVWTYFTIYTALKSSMLLSNISKLQIEMMQEHEEALKQVTNELKSTDEAGLNGLEGIKKAIEKTGAIKETSALPSESTDFVNTLMSTKVSLAHKISRIKEFFSKKKKVEHNQIEDDFKSLLLKFNPEFADFAKADQCLNFLQFYPLWDRLKKSPCRSSSQDILLVRLDLFSKKFSRKICFLDNTSKSQKYYNHMEKIAKESVRVLCPQKASELEENLPSVEDFKNELLIKEKIKNLLLILNSKSLK